MPNEIDTLKEFVADVEAVGVDSVQEDWPDLVVTYEHAKNALKDESITALIEASSLILDRLDEFGNIDSVREEGPIQDLRNALENIRR